MHTTEELQKGSKKVADDFAQEVKNKLREQDLTTFQAAKQAEVTNDTIHRAINSRDIRLSSMGKIMKALGINYYFG